MSAPEPFRITFAPGVTPGKWERIWGERVPRRRLELTLVEESEQLSAVRGGSADMAFVRLPVDREGLQLIPLYREVPVVVVPADHPVAAYDEIAVAELADEHLLQDQDLTTAQAIEVVASGTGIVIVPMSVARLHHRRDVTARPVTGVAESQVGLAWLSGNEDDDVETFVGIVRGRTARSSRARPPDAGKPEARAAQKATSSKRTVRPVRGRPAKGADRRRRGR